MLPALSANPVSERNYRVFVRHLLPLAPRPRVLVLGAGDGGKGMGSVLADPQVDWVESDLVPSRRARFLSDAHRVACSDASIDGVVAQAVLEHVFDPERATAEIRRVLKPGGLLYAETPFMQQVHAGARDFTRFTELGHRRLFRRFEQIDAGPCCGPGMALAWSWQGFLLSFSTGSFSRAALTAAARLSASWLKVFDRFLLDRPAARDAASAFFFLGRKSDSTVSDRELLKLYQGAQG